MLNISSNVLRMSTEPTIISSAGKIVYANEAAIRLLGRSCLEKDLNAVFGDEISSTQATSFIAAVKADGKRYILNVSRDHNLTVIFFSLNDVSPVTLTNPLLKTLRAPFLPLGAAVRTCCDEATIGTSEHLAALRSLKTEFYRLSRLESNISLVQNLYENNLRASFAATELDERCADLIARVDELFHSVDVSFESSGKVNTVLDFHLIELMLLNLISNAVIHANELTKIRVRLYDSADKLTFSVYDNGVGIAPGAFSSVLTRYSHLSDCPQPIRSAGLGLTAVCAVAEIHGGSVLLESSQRSGTTVSVSISKSLSADTQLRAPEPECTTDKETLFVGLADCLPEDCIY